jgi:hypothetical protein
MPSRLLILLLALVYLLGGTRLAPAAVDAFAQKKAGTACCCCGPGKCGTSCCCCSRGDPKPPGPSVSRCGDDDAPATPTDGGPDHQSPPRVVLALEAPGALAPFAAVKGGALSALLDPPAKVPV